MLDILQPLMYYLKIKFLYDISMSNGGVDGAYIQTSVYGGELGTWTHAWVSSNNFSRSFAVDRKF